MRKTMMLVLLLACFAASDAQKAKSTISAKITPMYGINQTEWVITMALPHCGRYDEPGKKFDIDYIKKSGIDGDELILVCKEGK